MRLRRMAIPVLKLLLAGLFVHITLFFAVVEIYFKSPLEHGLVQHKSLDNPPAHRVVLIVADGLRAESIYAKAHEDRALFLTQLRYGRAAWGLSHTNVPTESRPGHIAIMAGIYEDPSAIMKGWRINPVEFDSVINQSTNAWCFGSPDNVYLFNQAKSLHINEIAYSAEMQDFGKRATYELDSWVFQKLSRLLHDGMKFNCGSLCDHGNIFFLNLLGLDTAGHSYKPNSKEHIANIAFVDQGVQRIESDFETFFLDHRTAYIFTADHGMTDWGSHGGGSIYETETPFIAWGAGINYNDNPKDLKQTDIAPLISALIGINYPINSIGILPHEYLAIKEDKIARAMINNFKQISEIFKREEEKASTTFFYVPYGINAIEVLNSLEMNYAHGKYDEVINQSNQAMESLLDGLNYLRQYSSRPIFICISFGVIFWLIFLFLSVTQETRSIHYANRFEKFQFTLKSLIFALIFIICYASFGNNMSWTMYMYIILPLVMLLCVYSQLNEIIWEDFNLYSSTVRYRIKCTILSFLLVEIFVLGFHYRYSFTIFAVMLAFWPLTIERYRIEVRTIRRWILACYCLAVFPSLPIMKTSFNIYSFIITTLIWGYILFHYCTFADISEPDSIKFNVFKTLFRFQSSIYIMTVCNVLFIAWCFYNEIPVPVLCNVLSWMFSGISILIMYISPFTLLFRLLHIIISFMNIYTMFVFNIEGPFMLCLLYICYLFLKIEGYLKYGTGYKSVLKRMNFINDFSGFYPINGHNVAGLRRAFFYLGLILLSFFGTGNIANLNSFDPMWVRNFITVFSPFTMFGLIFLKITIPMLIITCVFHSVNIIAGVDTFHMFAIALVYCDIMLFNFVFLIKNTGSWLEIGTSFSHFIVMDIISVILIIFYSLTYLLTHFSLYLSYIICFEGYVLNVLRRK